MTTPTRTTIRYAAKQAYQLMLMRGLYKSNCAGCACYVESNKGVVVVMDKDDNYHEVKIAKAWANL